ncbi:hypothetical protein RDI58_017873 [Solanum bulbocastanum]|uniref:Uncharacterized protein n=1 Tax=Solanum bulbocastanum TaxID=147425 RepID=A0AAN8TGW8_SOLBU
MSLQITIAWLEGSERCTRHHGMKEAVEELF